MNYCQFRNDIIKRMANAGGGLLPAEYQQVEYLWSTASTNTNTTYIKTGYIPTQRYKSIVKVQYRETQSLCALGAMASTSLTSYAQQLTFGIVGGASGAMYYRAAQPVQNFSTYTWLNITPFVEAQDAVLIDDWITPAYSVDNVTVTPNNYFPSFANREFYLFARNNTGYVQGVMNYGSMRIYYAQIYNSNNQLERNYIPCYRKSDNKPGMYDTVNNTFNINAGRGEFTVGNNV